MDTLVIKKQKDVQIKKNIGRIFRGNNIFEYKSESDSFSIWDYNKILGIAYLYSSFEKIPLTDITVSIALTIFPIILMKFLKNERGLSVINFEDGIFHIDGDVVPIQILARKKLSPDNNLFLRNLHSNLSAKDMFFVLQSYKDRKPLDDRNVYLDRLVKANPDIFMEAVNMSETVMEIFLEGAEKYGWLEDRFAEKFAEKSKEIAKKLLLLGDPIERIVEATGLSIETVTELAAEITSEQ